MSGLVLGGANAHGVSSLASQPLTEGALTTAPSVTGLVTKQLPFPPDGWVAIHTSGTRHEGETPGARLPQRPALAGEATAHNGLIPIEGVVAVWKSPALSSGLAIVDEVSEPTRGSHRGVRVIR